MLPFSREQFFQVFGFYNEAIWPVQIVVYAVALTAVVQLFRTSETSDRIVSAVLGFMWLGTGIGYHWLYFSTINPAAWLFAGSFVAQGAVFLWMGVILRTIHFGYSQQLRCILGIVLIAYSAVIYPALGKIFGHGYPYVPLFGVTPCPVTLFTFGCFLFLTKPVPWWIVAIPVLWSAIGGSAAFLLGVPQDFILLISGLLTVFLLAMPRPRLLKWRN